MMSNSWLRSQRKANLLDLAESLGLTEYESLKKPELELALDTYLSANIAELSKRADLTGYFTARNRALAIATPVKKEQSFDDEMVSVIKRRAAAAPPPPIVARVDREPSVDAHSASSSPSHASFPPSPTAVIRAATASTSLAHARLAALTAPTRAYTTATRHALSTLTSVLTLIAAYELYLLRPAVLPNTLAFTTPAVAALHLPELPIYLPNMFLLLTSSFWSPVSTWLLTALVVPAVCAWFFNLRRAAHSRTYAVDPLVFSVVKALISFLVYAQGVTLGGLVSSPAVRRINAALYGGWRGILVGTAITGLMSFYDALLRR